MKNSFPCPLFRQRFPASFRCPIVINSALVLIFTCCLGVSTNVNPLKRKWTILNRRNKQSKSWRMMPPNYDFFCDGPKILFLSVVYQRVSIALVARRVAFFIDNQLISANVCSLELLPEFPPCCTEPSSLLHSQVPVPYTTRLLETPISQRECELVSEFNSLDFISFEPFWMDFGHSFRIFNLVPVEDEKVTRPSAPRLLHIPHEDATQYLGAHLVTPFLVVFGYRHESDFATKRVHWAFKINIKASLIRCGGQLMSNLDKVTDVSEKTIAHHGQIPPCFIRSALRQRTRSSLLDSSDSSLCYSVWLRPVRCAGVMRKFELV